MGNRHRGYYRKQRVKAIKRKYRIRKSLWGEEKTIEYYDNVPKGTLSKGKVHCSCYLCSAKTKRDGWKPSDQKRINSMKKNKRIFKEVLKLKTFKIY